MHASSWLRCSMTDIWQMQRMADSPQHEHMHERLHAAHVTYGSVQFMVNSARVRLKLDEARIAELLQEGSQSRAGGMSQEAASATARILGCLGDIGIASFAPGLSGQPCKSNDPSPAITASRPPVLLAISICVLVLYQPGSVRLSMCCLTRH